jgi:hypothetical protein
VALVPTMTGLAIRSMLRPRIPEARFKRVFFSMLLASMQLSLGVVIALRSTL